MKPPKSAYLRQWETLREIAGRRGRASGLFGFEYLFLLALCAILLVLPAMFVREIGGRVGYLGRKIAIDIYAVGKPTLLAVLLFAGAASSNVVAFISVVVIIDLYAYLAGLIFLRRFYTAPASPQRSLVLLGVNFAESIVAFSLLYGNLHVVAAGCTGTPESDPLNLLFFSTVTASTVGYGDFTVLGHRGRIIAIAQIVLSLIFVSVFVATFLTSATNSSEAAEPPKKE